MIRKNRPPDESDTARKIPPGMKVDRRGRKLMPSNLDDKSADLAG